MGFQNGVSESGSRNRVHEDLVHESVSLDRAHRFRFRPIISINLTRVFSALWLAYGRARAGLEACGRVRGLPPALGRRLGVLREHSRQRPGRIASWLLESVHGWMGQILGLLSIRSHTPLQPSPIALASNSRLPPSPPTLFHQPPAEPSPGRPSSLASFPPDPIPPQNRISCGRLFSCGRLSQSRCSRCASKKGSNFVCYSRSSFLFDQQLAFCHEAVGKTNPVGR